jgi:heptosyltransferase-1
MALAARPLEGKAFPGGRGAMEQARKLRTNSGIEHVTDPRILIVKTSSIGDVVHALPIARILKENLPGCTIGWVVRKRCADLLTGNPDIDNTYVVPDRPSPRELLRLRSALHSDRYDIALDLQGLLLSGVITGMSGARRRIGLDLNREANAIFMTEPLVPGKGMRGRHAIDILRGFLPFVGIDPATPWPTLRYFASESSALESLRRKAAGRPMVGLNLGASSIYKQWPVRHWIDLTARLVGARCLPVVIGGPQDVAAATALVDAVGDGVASVAGVTTLRESAGVIAACVALVTADTGPMHIAAAVGTSAIALFGATDPQRTGPYGSIHLVIDQHLACSPCFRHPTCGGRVDCMQQIMPQHVFELVMTRLTAEVS